MTTRDQLAARDGRILELLAAGYDSLQMGRALGCSTATVKNQIARLIREAGANNRAHLIAMTAAQPRPEGPVEDAARAVAAAHRACLSGPTSADYIALRVALDVLAKVIPAASEVTPDPQLAPVVALRSPA